MPQPLPEPGDEAKRGPGLATIAGIVIAGVALIVGLLLLLGVIGGGGFDEERISDVAREGGSEDPFAWEADRNNDFERRAALGYSHPLYEKSPGGIVASARRTAGWRDEIEAAAEGQGIDPDLMEAMVLLESAGRPDVIAGDDPEVASGIAQIVASTGPDLLDMKVDLGRSRKLTKQIAKAKTEAARKRLMAERARIDERFDPEKALAGMATYLDIAREHFDQDDLATASYHMGIGNLDDVLARYDESTPDQDPDYGRLFFDSSPVRNAEAWDLLSGFGDDSSTYLWRVMAAERVMDLYRNDRAELERLNELQTAKSTQEEVFHPEDATRTFADPDEVVAAVDDGYLMKLPDGADYGYAIDRGMGELASKLGVERDVYRALRPEALATLIYMASKVQAISGGDGDLTVTSTVRDQRYQDELVGVNDEATNAYSLHTTGYSFDILRDYQSDEQAEAFQFVLDRLRALDVIDYAVEPEAIHVTVSNEAAPLLDL